MRKHGGEFDRQDNGNRLNQDEEEDIIMGNDQTDTSDTNSDANSVHSKYSRGSKRSKISKRSSSSGSSLSNQVMKKIRKQKKKSKFIEKIFRCEKQEREQAKPGSHQKNSILDPLALKPIQETGMSGVSSMYLKPEP